MNTENTTENTTENATENATAPLFIDAVAGDLAAYAMENLIPAERDILNKKGEKIGREVTLGTKGKAFPQIMADLKLTKKHLSTRERAREARETLNDPVKLSTLRAMAIIAAQGQQGYIHDTLTERDLRSGIKKTTITALPPAFEEKPTKATLLENSTLKMDLKAALLEIENLKAVIGMK